MLGIELFAIWALYLAHGIAAAYEPPIWLTAFLIILIDRSVTAVSRGLSRLRQR